MKRLLLVLTPLLILTLALGTIGCEKEKATSVPTVTSGTTATPTPTGPPKPEGDLRIVLSDLFGESFEPLLVTTHAKTYLFAMFDFLVGGGPDGGMSSETGLASKWERSADYLSWTFYLREGVKFHNGDEVTADDVKFSLEQLGQPWATANQAKDVFNLIKEIVVDGPYKVTINLKNPEFFFDYRLSPVMENVGMITPKKYIEANGRDYFRQHPIGSGPYRFAEQKQGQYIKFEAVDNHFALGVPKYKTITLYKAPEQITRTAMLKSDQVDVMEITRDLASSLQKEGYNIFSAHLNDVVYLQFESYVGTSNPLSSPKVREALWLAIDAKTILDNLLAGQGELQGQRATYPYILGSVDLPPKPYDPERAKQLLKEAGYPERFANPTLNIYSFARAGYSEGPSMLEAIAAYWQKVGMQVKITPTDSATWVSGHRALTNANAVTFQAILLNKLWAVNLPAARSVPPTASTFYTNPPDTGYDDLVNNEMLKAKTVEEFVSAASKIFKYEYETTRYPVLFTMKRLFATSQKVKQWNPVIYQLDYLNLRDLAKR